MKTTSQKLQQEAIARLQILEAKGLSPNVRKEFEEDGTVYYSEPMNLGFGTIGILYWVRNEPTYMEAIRAFEEKYHGLVYHATLNHTSFGTLFTLFYVSEYEEEWETDREDLQDGYSLAYAYNFDCRDCSEFGSIAYQIAAGGLVRIG